MDFAQVPNLCSSALSQDINMAWIIDEEFYRAPIEVDHEIDEVHGYYASPIRAAKAAQKRINTQIEELEELKLNIMEGAMNLSGLEWN